MWEITSPKGIVLLKVWVTGEGELMYSVYRNGRQVLDGSRLGLVCSLGDFTRDFIFIKEERKIINEEYTLPAGKKAVYENRANEMALHFICGGYILVLRLRSYDDGAAFRYEIPDEIPADGSGFEVAHEVTSFRLSDGFDDIWLQGWVETYEGTYDHSDWTDTEGRDYGMPCLFHERKDDLWVMLTEANVYNTNGSYCSCHLRGMGGRDMRIYFAPEEKGAPIPSVLPFHTPWRVAIVTAGLNELVNTTLNYNLNPPSAISDTEWIRPGRCLWSWWENFNSVQMFSEQKRYVDFAAAIGFEGVTVDAEWDISWLKELCVYAHSKNVMIWLWSAMQYIDTPEKAQAKIPLWASCGVDGLKVDLFHNDSQHTMWQYEMIANLMAEYKLMINFHGATKCMGEGRTWPHLMTAEGILGMEHYRWYNWRGLPDAQHNCTIPFTRNVVGSMDYTPTGFSNPNRNTTLAHQMALSAVFESGATNISASIYYLEAWRGTDFLRRLKPVYEGVRVLSGYPGHHAAILRWVKNEWIIGCITNRAMTLRITLDFLPAGEFEADIYEDDLSGELMRVTRRRVTCRDTLELPLLDAGGAGVYIAQTIDALPEGVCSGYADKKRVEYTAATAITRLGSEPFVFDNGQAGIMLYGSAAFSVKTEAEGWFTVRLFYAAAAPWMLSINNGTDTYEINMPQSGADGIFISSNVALRLPEGDNTLALRRTGGCVPVLEKLHVIDNLDGAPQEMFLGAETARLSGGAELVRSDDGGLRIGGLGNGGEAVFAGIRLPHSGKYLLRFEYYAGENRDIYIQVNSSKTYVTNLHITSGWGFPWGFPHWNTREAAEILIDMEKGENSLRLFNENERAVHLSGIALIPMHIAGLPAKLLN